MPTVLVGGTTAENIDYFDVMDRWLPIVLVFVLGLSFVLLTVAFRSVVDRRRRRSCSTCSRSAPPTACSCSSSSTASARACSASSRSTSIEAWVPLFLFAVLFGLSMDYQVFLLSRIRERYSQTGDTTDAIAFGITLDGADHHRRRADHRRRLPRLRDGRPRHVPADGLRDRDRAADRRDDRPLGPRSRRR